MIMYMPEYHKNRTTQYVVFCVWLLSFSKMDLRLIHVAVSINNLLPFIDE